MAEITAQRPERSHISNAQVLANVKKKHDEAFKFISDAIMMEENERYEKAKALYSRGIRKIDEGLKLSADSADTKTQNKVQELQRKMKQARREADGRLTTLTSNNHATAPPENLVLPSYEEACGLTEPQSNDATGNMTYSQVNALLDNMLDEQSETEATAPQAHDLVNVTFMMNNVQIYFISPAGYVSAPSYPAPLRIINEGTDGNAGPALLQVGSWTYPLLPGASPILQQDSGCYIFPDVMSPEPGAAVGLIFPNEMSSAQRQLFEAQMKQLTVMQTVEVTPTQVPQISRGDQEKGLTSTKISNGLIKGGELISFGLCKGAEQATKLFKYGGTKIKQRLVPEEQPKKIDPRVQKGLMVAKETTGMAVVATGFIAAKVGEATVAIGKAVAPHIQKYGSEILSKATGSQSTAAMHKNDETVNGVMEVAAGGLKGFAAVYLGLETAAKILAKSITNETVLIVNKKYGDEAANVTDSSINSALNVALAARNITALGPKGIAKGVAKETGKAIVTDFKTNK